MSEEKKVAISFESSEILNLIDWFNGYISKYYGSDPATIKDNLPESHKNLIDKILTKYDEEFSFVLSKEEVELLGLEEEERDE